MKSIRSKIQIIATLATLVTCVSAQDAETSKRVARAEALLKDAAESAHTQRMWKGYSAVATAGVGVAGLALGLTSFKDTSHCKGQDEACGLENIGPAIAALGGGILAAAGTVAAIYQFVWETAPETYYSMVKNEASLVSLERALKQSADSQRLGRYVWSGLYMAGAAAFGANIGLEMSKGKTANPFYIAGAGTMVGLALWNLFVNSDAEDAYETYKAEFKTVEQKSAIRLQDLNVGVTPDSRGNNQFTVGASFKF
jgi:hypothetical protein